MNIENNKIIAEFMGLYQDKNGFWGFQNTPEHRRCHSDRIKDIFQYHSDWNWLMEVVEKIESLGSCQIDISFNWCRIGYKGNTIDSRNYLKSSSKIEAVYNACVEFIKWYNPNK